MAGTISVVAANAAANRDFMIHGLLKIGSGQTKQADGELCRHRPAPFMNEDVRQAVPPPLFDLTMR
jgi:hypothetical protein